VRLGRASCWALLLCVACDPGERAPTLELPHRANDAPSGTEVARDIRALDFEAREERIYEEVARGNVPTWLRQLERVEMMGEVGGRMHEVTFWVTPDYLAVGSDDDFFLVPLSPRTSQRIADLVGASLPTPRMVDAVWASARVRLVPIRIRPDEHMRTVRDFERHDALVQAQRGLRGVRPGVFVAGHKLDLVLSAMRSGEPGNVALYGWHLPDGSPLQPVFPVVMDWRPHFSLGTRLGDRSIVIDGARRDLSDVLLDPELTPLLSDAHDAIAALPELE
jgi:hypothetical protein